MMFSTSFWLRLRVLSPVTNCVLIGFAHYGPKSQNLRLFQVKERTWLVVTLKNPEVKEYAPIR